MKYRLDRGARRIDGGRILVGGSPLRLFRLTPGGRQVIDAIERGDDVEPSSLIDRLLDTGAIHPRPVGAVFTADDVTVVVPVYGHDPEAAVASVREAKAVVVVDDANEPPLAAIEGAILVRHEVRRGPGAARMSGLGMVDSPLVAFVDADCVAQHGWLRPLLAHFDDERVGLAAPRVRSTAGDDGSALARYEQLRSPLDLGPVEARIAPRTRVPFVPAAALLVRVDALREVGGFDASLRVGEDVDLVWRMVAFGWRGRYEPRSVVTHCPRPTLSAMARQRVAYGRSATSLHVRHPGAVAPAIVGPWAAGGWTLLALGHPFAGLLAAAVPTAALMRALPAMAERRRLAARLAALAFVRVGQQLASILTREWWPATLVAAVLIRRLRLPILAAATVPALLDWAAAPGGLDPARYAGLRLIDDAAYGAGVWWGAWDGRDVGALVPLVAGRARAGPPVQRRPRSDVEPAT